MAEEGLVKSTGVGESKGACNHGFSTDFNEAVSKLARKEAGLRSGPANIGQ